MERYEIINKLQIAQDEGKGDWETNQYLINRLKNNQKLYNSDKIYLSNLLDIPKSQLCIIHFNINHTRKEKDDKKTNLKKCNFCNYELKLDDKTIRNNSYWYHENCFAMISKKRESKIQPVSKIKHDPVVILIGCVILAFVVLGPFYFISDFSAGGMLLGGILVLYQLLDVKRWSKKDFKAKKRRPSFFSLFLLYMPFVMGGILAFEGYTLWNSIYRAMILWGFTITFWSVMLMVPLALISKYKEDQLQTPSSIPMISVIIPAYNEEKVIAKTIESTLEIDYPKKEIIVVDDGSIDKTLQVAKHYVKDGVKVLHKQNGGKASALNFAMTFSKGDIMAVLDADTIVGKTSLMEIAKVFADDKNILGVAGNIKIKNKKNWITWNQALEYISGLQITRRAFDMFGAIAIIPGALGAFRRAPLEGAGSYDKDTIVEDFDATLKVLKSGGVVKSTTKSLAFTEAPTTLKDFIKQRKRWYRGNLQVLFKHRNVFANARFGFLHKLIYPYMAISMIVLPVSGFIMLGSAIFALLQGDVTFVVGSFVFFVILQYLLAMLAVRIEKEDPKLVLYAIFSVIGFKQIIDALLIRQLFEHILRRKPQWSRVKR